MTNAEFAILGMVSEGPRYGYQIEQDIEERGMRDWTDIGFSSIYYILNKLEKAGYLNSEMMIESYRPARKIYHLTDAGRHQFRSELLQRLAQPRPRSDDFDLALSNMAALAVDEVIGALVKYHDTLIERMKHVEKRWNEQKKDLPQHVNHLFDHNVAMMQAELDWVAGLLRSLQK